MMKSCKPLFVVDSVEDAVKFYTEKLGFDVVELAAKKEDGRSLLAYAQLKKGKCFVGCRVPSLGELAEMSMVKHCAGRGAGVYILMKKGLDKYLQRCTKKGVTIVDQPKKQPWGDVTFSIKDPFGFRLTFAQPLEVGEWRPSNEFCGMGPIERPQSPEQEARLLEDMVAWLKGFGLLRRVSKKFSRLWLKQTYGKK
jgi:uncharacterized glyoxalase superfamily protein PhnB